MKKKNYFYWILKKIMCRVQWHTWCRNIFFSLSGPLMRNTSHINNVSIGLIGKNHLFYHVLPTYFLLHHYIINKLFANQNIWRYVHSFQVWVLINIDSDQTSWWFLFWSALITSPQSLQANLLFSMCFF